MSKQNRIRLLRIPAAGKEEILTVSDAPVPPQTLAALLDTDVTERMRVPAMPKEFADADFVLCYFLDARGGEKPLPANFIGTCFYHTGCPIFGDLILAACTQDSDSAEISGLTPEQCSILTEWLHEQFPEYLSGEQS